MKVLMKGAGDLASGIACRLFRCGFALVMTETEVPTTVRRTVAFSRAVYEKRAMVEDVEAILCRSLKEIEDAVSRRKIAVIVDERCLIREEWKPDVVVDSIIAKKNLGTSIRDAETVIGVGPGFEAGVDCHCVVETMRGHNLGRCIWSGSAQPNTGVPGVIGGYDVERIIRAQSDGIFKGMVEIGTQIEAGQLVGYSGDTPIYALIGGIVRGILQDGVWVVKGMKSGDIDPRCEADNCRTVSDKALAVGGGVLEAILHHSYKNKMLAR